MTHAVLVVDRLVLMAAVEDAARLGAGRHGRPLPLHADQVLVQVAAERSPDRIVMIDAGRAFLRRVALETQAAELDHDLVGTERRHDIASQRRAAQVEVHAGEHVDHVPLVRRQMRKRQRRAAVEPLVFLVVDLERADDDVAVVERFVLAREVRVVKAGDAVMVVHEIVIEFAVGVVPQLVVRVDDRLVVVEHFERLGIERLAQARESRRRPVLQRHFRIVVEIDPHEAAELHLAAQPAKAYVLLAKPLLVALFLPADVDAVAAHVVLPRMEHAGHALGVS